MHFTANNEPRALEVLGDLDPSVFEEVYILTAYNFELRTFAMVPNCNVFLFFSVKKR